MSIDLKPCPFCGGPGMEVGGNPVFVMCGAPRHFDSPCPCSRVQTTIKLWNTRHEAAKVEEQPVEMSKLLSQYDEHLKREHGIENKRLGQPIGLSDVERVAVALCHADIDDPGENDWQSYGMMAKAAIAAMPVREVVGEKQVSEKQSAELEEARNMITSGIPAYLKREQ